jgi:hypothetical protein
MGCGPRTGLTHLSSPSPCAALLPPPAHPLEIHDDIREAFLSLARQPASEAIFDEFLDGCKLGRVADNDRAKPYGSLPRRADLEAPPTRRDPHTNAVFPDE